jgi:Putative DNA-binding domain
MADPGRDLFERLKAKGWPLVDEWIGRQEPEALHLESKTKANEKTPRLEDGDKSSIAKPLSGFANVEGGLLVIGIEARKSKDGVDCLHAAKEIADVEAFRTSVNEQLAHMTDPPIAGIDLHAVHNPAKPGAGVLAVYVPPSSGGPHRATGASSNVNDRYYMRTSSSTVPIPHRLLATLFAFGAPPRLEFRARITQLQRGMAPRVELRLANRGRTAAQRPALMIFERVPLNVMEHDSQHGFVARPGSLEDGRHYRLLEPVDGNRVIYGGSEAVVWTGFGSPDYQTGVLRFEVRIMSLSGEPIEGQCELRYSDDPKEAVSLHSQRAVVAGDHSGTGEQHR